MMKKKRRDRKVFLPEALRRIRAQGPYAQLRSLRLLFRATLDQISFLVSGVIPAIPVTLRAIYKSCDERNSAYHLYGASRPGVMTIYVHGGAWGASSARDHAALGARMSNVFDGPVFVTDQNVWPRGDLLRQANDVADVLRVAQERYPGRKSVLVAHSSGAHSAAVALANGSTSVDVAVLQAGVYDPLAHYCHEGTRGVETVSPMTPAGNADEDVVRLQDYTISKFFRKAPLANIKRKPPSVHFSLLPLEGDREAYHIRLPGTDRSAPISWGATSGTFVMAAAEDDVVPLSSSLRFLKSLRTNGANARFLLYTGTKHMDFAFDWIRESSVNEGTLDIDARDKTRRRTAFTVSHGKVVADLKEEVLPKDAPLAEHARDFCRIMSAVAGTQSGPPLK